MSRARAVLGGVLGASLLLVSTPAAAQEVSAPRSRAQPFAPDDGQLTLKVMGGADYRNLYGVPIYGGDARIAAGGKLERVSVYGTLGALVGQTQYGLGTIIVDAGASVERHFGLFGLGLMGRFSYLHVDRAASSQFLDTYGIGLAPFASIDLFKWDTHALFLAVTMNLDAYEATPVAFVWGPTLSLGYREN